MEKPTTIIYGNQYNFGDINGGTQNFCNIPKEKIKFGVTIPENLIPRRDMLDRLEAEFKSRNCVVVSGIGGSGKTSLAYLYAKEKEFNNIIWITVNGKIEDVFVDRIAGQLLSNEDYEKFSQIEDKQTKLDIIKNSLSNIAGNNLLVLDINSNDDETKQEIESDLYNYLPANYWKTLVLTRTKAINTKRFITVDMTQMTDSEAFDLFKSNFQRNIQFSDAQLAEIAKELYYHPLLIEQTAIYFTDGFENSAEEIIVNIKEKNKVSNERTNEDLSGLIGEGRKEKNIKNYLLNLCNIKTLSDEEKNFLAVYVTWPTEPINKETIDTLMPGYETTLKKLIKKGILSRNGNQIVIHSLIADVLREQIEIDNHDYSEYFGNINNELNDGTKYMLLHKYSKCIASSFINYGICKDKDIVLFREFLINLLNNGDPILYNLPESKYSDMITKLANKAEPYQKAQLYNAAAGVEEVRSHLKEAKSLYEKGLAVINKKEESTDNLKLKGALLNNLAGLEQYKLGDLDAAKEHYQEAIEIMRKLPESPENRKYLATHLNNLAILEEEKFGDYDASKKHKQEAIEIKRKLPESPENSKSLATGLNNLAALEEKLGDLHAAKEHYNEAIEIMRNLPESPENRKSLATHLNNLALHEKNLGDFAAAKEHYQEAIEIDRNLPESPDNRKNLATDLHNLAMLEEDLGDLDAAKEHYKEATEIMRNLPESPENRKSLAKCLNNLAGLEEDLGDIDAAKEHYKEAIEIDKNLPESPENRKSLATDLNNLALLEKNLGDLDAAKEHYQEAIEIMKNVPESPENLYLKMNILTGLGMLDAQLGDINSAKEHWKKALEIAKQIQNEKYIKIFELFLSRLPS